MNKIFKTVGLAVIAAAAAFWSVPAALAIEREAVIQNRQQPDTSSCLGERVTSIVPAGEMWSGGNDTDVVVVLGTGSIVSSQGGGDKICVYDATLRGGYTGSQIFSGDGNDTVITYGGNNNIDTGIGNDLIYLNGGVESVTAAEDDDHIWGLGAERITAYGGSGNDLVVGSRANDSLNGGSGDDVILANDGNDTITELYGSNKLYGGAGTDTITGGADYDLCHDSDEDTTFTYCEAVIQSPAPPLPEAS